MCTCGAYQQNHASLVTHPRHTDKSYGDVEALCHPLGYGFARDLDHCYTSVSLPSPAASLLFSPVLAGLSWLLLQSHLQFAETLKVQQYLRLGKETHM